MKVQVYGHQELISVPQPVLLGALSRPALAPPGAKAEASAPALVAEWAGHNVAVLLKVDAKCIDGQDQIAKRRIEDALRDPGKPEEDTPHKPDGDG